MSLLKDTLDALVPERSEYGHFEAVLMDGTQTATQLGRNLQTLLNKNNNSPYVFATSQGGQNTQILVVCDKNAGTGPQLPLLRIEMERLKVKGQEAWTPTSLITAKDPLGFDGPKSELVDMMNLSKGQLFKSEMQGLGFLGHMFEHLAHGGSVYQAMNHGLNGRDADDVLKDAKAAPIRPIQIDSKGHFSSVAEAKRETEVPVKAMKLKK